MNPWYDKSPNTILRGEPDFDVDDIKVSLRDDLIAATLTMRRDGANSQYSAFRHEPDPGMMVTR